MTDDLVRRTPLTDPDRTTAAEAVPAIVRLLPTGTVMDCPTSADFCAVRYRPADPDQVRDALAAAGYRDAIVRVARADDPAPEEAVVFTVPIGPACLLGYHTAEGGPGQVRVVGQLPDGTCLPR